MKKLTFMLLGLVAAAFSAGAQTPDTDSVVVVDDSAAVVVDTAAVAEAPAVGPLPAADFKLVVLNDPGSGSLFSKQLKSLDPTTEIHLVIYDPDCAECHTLLDSLKADTDLSTRLADGTAKVFVVAPQQSANDENEVLNIIMMMNGDILSYPSTWKFGLDGGTIIENDSFVWDTLPLHTVFPAGSYVNFENK